MHSFTIHSFNQLILSVWCARFSSRQRGTCRIRWSVLPSGSAQSAGETRISITTIKKCERCRVGDIGGYYLWRQLLLELWAYLPFLGVFEQEGTLVSTAATLLFLHGGPLVPRETNGLELGFVAVEGVSWGEEGLLLEKLQHETPNGIWYTWTLEMHTNLVSVLVPVM